MSNMIINTNVLALNSHRNLGLVGKKQEGASKRLSSGYRINSAADDASGLAISEKMRAQIRGLDMAHRNTQDGISLIQTAEGGMQEINNMLTRTRELLVQASNDTAEQSTVDPAKSQGDREKIQQEINQLMSEIDSMAERVEFNKKKVINGSFSDTTQSLADATVALAAAATESAAANKAALNANTDLTSATTDLARVELITNTYTSQLNIKNNAYAAQRDLSSNAIGTVATGSIDAVDGNNGNYQIAAQAALNELATWAKNGSIDFENMTIADMEAKVSAVFTSHLNGAGIWTGLGGAPGAISMTANSIGKTGANVLVGDVTIANGGALDAVVTVPSIETMVAGASTAIRNLAIAAKEVAVFKSDGTAAGLTAALGGAAYVAADGAFAGTQSFFHANYIGGGLPTTGNANKLTAGFLYGPNAAAAPTAMDSTAKLMALLNSTILNKATTTRALDNARFDQDRANFKNDAAQAQKDAAIELSGSAEKLHFQIGANSRQSIEISIGSIKTNSLGLGDGGVNGVTTTLIDVVKATGKQVTDYIDAVDQALTQTTSERAKLGALQNRLEFTSNSLSISSENLSASESRVRDADMAKEMMNLTQANVLQQAATSMLAQANQSKQSILQVLQ